MRTTAGWGPEGGLAGVSCFPHPCPRGRRPAQEGTGEKGLGRGRCWAALPPHLPLGARVGRPAGGARGPAKEGPPPQTRRGRTPRRGRGTEGTARGRKPVSGAGTRGRGRHRPAPQPGTPGLPPPTGSPLWTPPAPVGLGPALRGRRKAALTGDTWETCAGRGAGGGFSSYSDGPGPEPAAPPGRGTPPHPRGGLFGPQAPRLPGPPLGSQARPPPAGPHPRLLFFWADCPSPRRPLALTHT